MNVEDWLIKMADSLIRQVTTRTAAEEGKVVSLFPAPYRRLDCDKRALAYVRIRPRKGAVRVDVSSLWRFAALPDCAVPSSAGACFLIRTELQLAEVVEFLVATIEKTRQKKDAQ